MNLTLADYSDETKQEILQFFSDVPFKALMWDWQFLESPQAEDTGFKPVISQDEIGVTAFNGVMPVKFKYRHDEIEALWSCDFHVAERVRGTGLGKALKFELKSRAPLIMSLGVSPTASIVLQKMGWVRHDCVKAYRRYESISSWRDVVFWALQTANRVLFRYSRLFEGDVILWDHLPTKPELDELWAEVSNHYQKAVVRDHQYLHWRYCQHPLAKYQFIHARESDNSRLRAVLVVRYSDSVLRIVDYLGPLDRKDIFLSMLRLCSEHFPRLRQWVAVTSDPMQTAVLKAFGFYQARSHPAFYVLDKVNSESQAGWFISSGDSDGEALAACWDNWNSDRRSKPS